MTLEEAVARFLASYDEVVKRKHAPLSDLAGAVVQLEAVYAPPGVERAPYRNEAKKAPGDRDETEETHESYGLVHISRVSGYRRLFASSVKHNAFFRLTVSRGRRVLSDTGEHFFDTYSAQIIEIDLSPAQFVEMITTPNMGSGVPCTIASVQGVRMDDVPEGIGTELEYMAEDFKARINAAVEEIPQQEAALRAILEKKAFNKEDKAEIQKIVWRVNRLLRDSAPFVMKVFGENVEKMVAKGKTEIESFVQLALTKAGIKAIKDAGGTILLGDGEEK